MTISVVLTTYNGRKYLKDQMDSLAGQSRPADEVIILDDDSTDETVPMIQQYIRENHLSGWRLIRHETNQGWKKNFTEGFDLAAGDLIFPCDQDDIWYPDKIERMESCMQEHPELEMLAGNYTIFFSEKDQGHGSQKYRENGRKMKSDGSLVVPDLDPRWPYILRPGCVTCFRKSFYEAIRGAWDVSYAYDAILWRYARMDHALGILNIPVIQFRRHGDNATSYAVRTVNSRVETFQEYIIFHQIAEKRVKSDKDRIILRKGIIFLQERIRFFRTKSFPIWLKLALCYQPYYLSFSGCLGDLYYVYLGNRKRNSK